MANPATVPGGQVEDEINSAIRRGGEVESETDNVEHEEIEGNVENVENQIKEEWVVMTDEDQVHHDDPI